MLERVTTARFSCVESRLTSSLPSVTYPPRTLPWVAAGALALNATEACCKYALALFLIAGSAQAQSQIHGRVMVMIDTSGSMMEHFGDCFGTGGDSGAAAVYCDNQIGSTFACNKNLACTTGANGGVAYFPTTLNNPSRLYSAKVALTNFINSAGGLEFGLERYAPNTCGFCSDGTYCCTTTIGSSTRGRCIDKINSQNNYTIPPQSKDGNNFYNITFYGGCGTTRDCSFKGCKGIACVGTEGGQILVTPGSTSSVQVLPWVDFVEDFCSSTGQVGGPPRNPELRAAGPTPLAGSIRTARKQWYQPIFNASNGGNCNPILNASCDPQINCRPYVNVVMTDGGESCEDSSVWFTDPQKAVQELTAVNPTNPVKTYVIAVAFVQNELCNDGQCQGGCGQNNVCKCQSDGDCGSSCDGVAYVCVNNVCQHPALGSLNAMAAAGGSGTARFANNQTDLEAAFADIAASSVVYEKCNGADDTCNGFIDEGLGVFQDCTQNNQCGSGSCSSGRCTCSNNGQCANGFLCSQSRCVPSCTVGVGACRRTGVKKCDQGGVSCCVNDGQANCTPLTAGQPMAEVCDSGIDSNCDGMLTVCGQNCSPQPETCNGKDDDCDGIIDDNLIDVPKPCGLSVGICQQGSTACQPTSGQFPNATDRLVCLGGIGPVVPLCNGCDNDCDGITDKPKQSCYSGPANTVNVGICIAGTQECTAKQCPQAATWGPCSGEVVPQTEICNGLDDDCNGSKDDVQGLGALCCPWSGLCGKGICLWGTKQCSGNSLQCVGASGPLPEVCNGLDDDCNGTKDDVPGLGQACTAPNGCPGELTCDLAKLQLGCTPFQQNCAMNPCADPKVGKPCGNPQNLPPPCKAGIWVCKNNQVICEGAMEAKKETCDGLDQDCDGQPDNGAPCPINYICYQGNCDPLCSQAEFPCAGGYSPAQVNGQCICVPDKTCNPPCGAGLSCDPLTGQCVDRCLKVICPSGLQCSDGLCYGCEKFGCSQTCNLCDHSTRMCKPDLCCMAQCPMGSYCDPGTGHCISGCANGCAACQRCAGGACVPDPCCNVHCPNGDTCDPKTGTCKSDSCAGVQCGPGLACCSGSCVNDPCSTLHCPDGTRCKVNSLSCETGCYPSSVGVKDRIVGAGGGGLACQMGRGARAGWPLALLLLLLVGRRRGVRA